MNKTVYRLLQFAFTEHLGEALRKKTGLESWITKCKELLRQEHCSEFNTFLGL